jgi:hypothetical protein
MKQIASWIWSNVILPLFGFLGLGALASQAFDSWLRQRGYLDHPETLIATVVAWLGDQAKSWWLLPICALALIAPGIPVAYRKYAARAKKRDEERETLGKKMTSMASQVRIAQGGFRNQWPENIRHLRGALEAIFAKAHNFSLSSPDNDVFASDGPERLLDYLDTIGSHLRQGNFSVAKKRSRDLST